jgi:tRNA(Ile)-lysidine synthase TilS/MesJ
MRDLGVEFIYETNKDGAAIKDKLEAVARRRGFNVIALGNSLDKLADDFLSSIFYKGKIHTKNPWSKER